jgi:hypothetical protein
VVPEAGKSKSMAWRGLVLCLNMQEGVTWQDSKYASGVSLLSL